MTDSSSSMMLQQQQPTIVTSLNLPLQQQQQMLQPSQSMLLSPSPSQKKQTFYPSEQVLRRARLTQNYAVEKRTMLSSTKKFLEIRHIKDMPTGHTTINDDFERIKIFLKSTRDDPLEEIDLRNINISTGDEGNEQFTLTYPDGSATLFCSDKVRLLTELNLCRSKLGLGSNQHEHPNVLHQRDIFTEDPEENQKSVSLVATLSAIVVNYKNVRMEAELTIGKTTQAKRADPNHDESGDDSAEDIWIFYMDIQAMYFDNNVFYIIKKNNQIEKFIIQDNNKNRKGTMQKHSLMNMPSIEKEFKDTIRKFQQNAQQNLGINIMCKFETIQPTRMTNQQTHQGDHQQASTQQPNKFEDRLINEYLPQLKFEPENKDQIYKIRYKTAWNSERQVKLQLTTRNLYLFTTYQDGATQKTKLTYTAQIADLTRVIVLKPYQRQLVLTFMNKNFYDDLEITFIDQEHERTNEFISCMLYQRDQFKTNRLPVEVIPLLDSNDLNELVIGAVHSENPAMFPTDVEYESYLLSRLCLILERRDIFDPHSLMFLKKLNFNASFFGDNKIDYKLFKQFVYKFKQCTQIFWNNFYEDEDEAGNSLVYYDSELDTDSMDDEEEIKQSPSDQYSQEYINNDSWNSELEDEQEFAQAKDQNPKGSILQETTAQKVPGSVDKITERLARMILLLTRMMNNKGLFREIIHEKEVVVSLLKLLHAENFYISYLAGQCICSMLKFFSESENKFVQKNREFILNSDIDLMKYLDRHLRVVDRFQQEKGSTYRYTLVLKTVIDIINTMVDSPSTDNDLFKVVVHLFKDDLRIIHIIERLSLSKLQHLSVSFLRIINKVLYITKKPIYSTLIESHPEHRDNNYKSFGEIQYRFFTYTVQLLHCIKVLIRKNPSKDPWMSQDKQCFEFFMIMVHRNEYAVQVLKRMFKKFLFYKVNPNAHNSKNNPEYWTAHEWKEFFSIVHQDFQSATELWNQHFRDDLEYGLQQETRNFQSTQEEHRRAIFKQDKERKDRVLTHPTHLFNTKGEIFSSVQNLKWNYKEFKINFSSETSLFKVGKYYLQQLLIEKDDAEPPQIQQQQVVHLLNTNFMSYRSGPAPTITNIVNTHKPRLSIEQFKQYDLTRFWEQLHLRFMQSEISKERMMILKCMILLYQKHAQLIGKLQTLPYWLNLLQEEDYRKCHLLVLQFILASLSVKQNNVANENYNIFNKNNGIQTLLACINVAFRDIPIKDENNVDNPYKGGGGIHDDMSDMTSENELILEMGLANNQQSDVRSIKSDPHSTILREFGKEDELQRAAMSDAHSDFLLDEDDNEQPCVNNYTDVIEDSQFFFNRSEYINIALLIFEILNFIMRKPINNRVYPLPKSKEIMIKANNIRSIAQLLLINDPDLTRAIVKHIWDHFDSQYCLHKFQGSGIIEFLLLYLTNLDINEKDSNAAYLLLQRMQIVFNTYNQDLDLKLFDDNDQKLIEAQGIANSVLLRFLPLPLIMKIDNPKDKPFLDTFRENSYEKATLIWNKQMREQVRSTILSNVETLKQQLREFAHKPLNYLRQMEKVPGYRQNFNKVIEYENLLSEVRCGQYYLRIWVRQCKEHEQQDMHSVMIYDQNDQQNIPDEYLIQEGDQDDFKDNLQKAIREINMKFDEIVQKEHQKIITILEASYQVTKTFNRQDFFACLKELMQLVNKFIVAIQNKKMDYTDYVQTVFKIITATVFEAINIEDKKKNQQQRHNNLTQLLEFDTNFNLIEDLMSLIIQQQSFRQREESLDSDTICLKLLEGEILQNCTKIIMNLIEDDKKKYLERSYDKRLGLFRKFTRILDCSHHIIRMIKEIKEDENEKDKKPQYGSGEAASSPQRKFNNQLRVSDEYLQPSKIQSLGFGSKAQDMQNKKILSINTDMAMQSNQVRDLKSPNAVVQIGGMLTGRNRPTKAQNTTRNNKTTTHQKMNSHSQPKQNINIADQQKPKEEEKDDYQNKNIDLTLTKQDVLTYLRNFSKIENIQNKLDKSLLNTQIKINTIFNLAVSVFSLSRKICYGPWFHAEIIESGFIWMTIQHIFFNLQRVLAQRSWMRKILDNCAITLILVTSNANRIRSYTDDNLNQSTINKSLFEDSVLNQSMNAQSHFPLDSARRQPQDEDQPIQREKILNYWDACTRIFPKKILVQLLMKFQLKVPPEQNSKNPAAAAPPKKVNMPRIIFENDEQDQALKFMKIFSIDEERTPELIWNDLMRKELIDVLIKQLSEIENNYDMVIKEFQYSMYSNELIVDGIFVRHFNSDIFFKPKDVRKFVVELFKHLRLILKDSHVTDLDNEQFENVMEITKAIRNLIEYQNVWNILDNKEVNLQKNISLFCMMCQSKTDIEQDNDHRLIKISDMVLDILKFIINNNVEEQVSLIETLEFVKMAARTLKLKSKDQTSLQQESGTITGGINTESVNKISLLLHKIMSKENNKMHDKYEDNTYSIQKFLNKDGMVLFLLEVIFNKLQPIDKRVIMTQLIRDNIDIEQTKETINAFMPVEFFTNMHKAKGYESLRSEQAMIHQFLKDLDSTAYENIFLKWDDEIKREQQYKIQERCNRILKRLDEQDDDSFKKFNFTQNDELEVYKNQNTLHEICILGVITRVFNNNSGLYIDNDFTDFLEGLTAKCSEQATQLNRLIMSFAKKNIDIDVQVDDIWIPFNEQGDKGLIVQKAKKLYKYLKQQNLYVLTSLILTLEQVYHNDFRQTKQSAKEQEGLLKPTESYQQKRRQTAFGSQSEAQNLIQSLEQQQLGKIPDNLIEFLLEQMQQDTYITNHMEQEMRIAFLQLLFWIPQVKDLYENDKLIDGLASFLRKSIECLANLKDQKRLEGSLIMILTYKLVQIVNHEQHIKTLFDFSRGIDGFTAVIVNQPDLKIFVQQILMSIGNKFQSYKEIFLQKAKQREQNKSYYSDKDFKWDEVVQGKKTSANELIGAEIWRPGPTDKAASYKHYEIEDKEHMLLEELTDSNLQINKIKLPIISKKAIIEIAKQDCIDSEEQKQLQVLLTGQ